ncbi:MAG TPA: DUF1080 domain-containing protein [Porphyromonadaceae bacterium]|nr:DUF1080 domain-containing protein [Porphyromonadaceae bacterium]
MKKTILVVSAVGMMVFASCGGGKKADKAAEEQKEAPVETKAEVVDPKLVAEGPYEKLIAATAESPAYVLIDKPQVNLEDFPKDKDGYYVIFDGKTFNGWRGYNKDSVPGRWIIEDGALKFNGAGFGEAQEADGGDIIFTHKFKNFELAFDWKVAKGSNSGVFFHAQEIKGEPIYISSPEYQILDNVNHEDAKQGKDGNRQSASLYDMIPAKPQNSKPFGEWNTGSITVSKGSVFHKQNGQTVVEYHLWTPKWNELIKNSKFAPGGDFPLAFKLLTNLGGDNREGYIGFQDHNDDVWFKNIRVRIIE